MVLTDREIEMALKANHIAINPAPPPEAYTSSAVDLRLGTSLRRWVEPKTPGVHREVSPATPGYQVNNFIKEFTEPHTANHEGFVISPGEFILAWTHEEVSIPFESRLAARVEGKSSLARLGVGIHVTAPTIHSGFKGPIQLELCNHGKWKVRLIPGMRVCQLIFEQTLGTPSAGYRGQFQGPAADLTTHRPFNPIIRRPLQLRGEPPAPELQVPDREKVKKDLLAVDPLRRRIGQHP